MVEMCGHPIKCLVQFRDCISSFLFHLSHKLKLVGNASSLPFTSLGTLYKQIPTYLGLGT